jgi:hypothetical protein
LTSSIHSTARSDRLIRNAPNSLVLTGFCFLFSSSLWSLTDLWVTFPPSLNTWHLVYSSSICQFPGNFNATWKTHPNPGQSVLSSLHIHIGRHLCSSAGSHFHSDIRFLLPRIAPLLKSYIEYPVLSPSLPVNQESYMECVFHSHGVFLDFFPFLALTFFLIQFKFSGLSFNYVLVKVHQRTQLMSVYVCVIHIFLTYIA